MEEQEEKIIKLENWRNLFKWSSWQKELVWIVIILLLCYSYWAYKTDMKICLEIQENPCPYCFSKLENEKARQGGMNITFNIPELKEVNNSLNAT